MRSFSLSLLLLSAWTVSAQDAGTASRFAGTWKIDLEACSDPAPMLEHYEANIFIRKFARSIAPTNIITWKTNRFDLEVQAPFFHRTTTVFLDGKTSTADDILGNPYEYTSVIAGEAIISKGLIKRKDGTNERFELTRTLEPNGTMVTRMTIFVKDGRPLEVKRVFKRQPAD